LGGLCRSTPVNRYPLPEQDIVTVGIYRLLGSTLSIGFISEV